MKKRTKKKAFTLVELIAVIAILGILAVIIVPRVANYTAKASSTKKLADAKTIAQAVELYNSECADTTHTIQSATTYAAIKGILFTGGATGAASFVDANGNAVTTGITDGSAKKYLSSWPSDVTFTDYAEILTEINTH